MKYKILIIGKKSFIASNLYNYLRTKCIIKLISYSDFINKKSNLYEKYRYIINCSSNKKYINNNYNSDYDFDFQIAKKIKKFQTKLVFLSTRKVYFPNNNIKEKDKIFPKCNYSKNKFITENKVYSILKNKVLILRISNLIGQNYIPSKRKLHLSFLDIFFKNIKKGIIFDNKIIYKDFLPINIFCKIVYLLINRNISGTYNVSLGKKVFLYIIVNWLNCYNNNKYKLVTFKKNKNSNENRDSFYLNNNKLKSKINIDIQMIDLKKECKKISKIFFNEKK